MATFEILFSIISINKLKSILIGTVAICVYFFVFYLIVIIVTYSNNYDL